MNGQEPSGYEPTLIVKNRRKGYQRLSSRRLASLLNTLPTEALSLNAAAEMLYNGGFYARYNAARLLSERGTRSARLILQDVLSNGSAPSRASAARHLHRFSWFSAAPLLRQALDDPDERVRESAVYALCDYRERSAYRLLAEIVPGETDTVKKAAAWGLRNCPDSAAVPVLEAALTATDPDVRINVLEALSANNTPEALRVVRTALDDPDSEVVYNAVLSLVEMEEDASILEISQLIDRVDGVQLEPILRGLFHATNYLHLPLAEHPAVHVLLDALAHAVIDPAPETRQAVVWILAWMRHDDATDLLRYLYHQEQNITVKAHILRVTRALMNDAGDELLADAVSSGDTHLIQAVQPFKRVAHFDQRAVAAAPLAREKLAWR